MSDKALTSVWLKCQEICIYSRLAGGDAQRHTRMHPFTGSAPLYFFLLKFSYLPLTTRNSMTGNLIMAATNNLVSLLIILTISHLVFKCQRGRTQMLHLQIKSPLWWASSSIFFRVMNVIYQKSWSEVVEVQQRFDSSDCDIHTNMCSIHPTENSAKDGDGHHRHPWCEETF